MAEKKKSTTKKVTTASKSVKKSEAKVEKSVAKSKAAPKVVKSESKKEGKSAVISMGGTQLLVVEGGKYEMNKVVGNKGDKIESSEVLLLVDGDNVTVGNPTVAGAKVSMVIDSQKKGDKIETFKFKAKSRYRRRSAIRPQITRVLVEKISTK